MSRIRWMFKRFRLSVYMTYATFGHHPSSMPFTIYHLSELVLSVPLFYDVDVNIYNQTYPPLSLRQCGDVIGVTCNCKDPHHHQQHHQSHHLHHSCLWNWNFFPTQSSHGLKYATTDSPVPTPFIITHVTTCHTHHSSHAMLLFFGSFLAHLPQIKWTWLSPTDSTGQWVHSATWVSLTRFLADLVRLKSMLFGSVFKFMTV